MPPPGRRRGDTGAFPEHPCLHRDKPCAMKTPGMPDFSTMWYVPTAKPQISLRLGAVWSLDYYLTADRTTFRMS